jgi:Protein of unknown function (DUF4231)
MAEIPTDRLSLVVGVTGHRDIAGDDEPPLRAAFGGILERLGRTCPHTPLLVLSGLAAGADSLAAEEALARNIPVMACLPMPVAEYEKDFSPEELALFRKLLAACARVTVTSPTRQNGYVATGLFIAQYSHLLVAFWDEKTSRGPGGTADVISMRLAGRRRSADIEEIPYLPDVGPVDIIVTPRTSAPRPPDPYAVKRRYPKIFAGGRTIARNFDSILGNIDVYNADLALVPASRAGLPTEALMQHTDAVANLLQRRTNRFQMMLFVFAFVAAAAQVGHVPPLFKIIALGLAFFAYGVARKNDYENRYQDYRAVAEGLRVQSAWYCAGVQHRLVDNEYLRMQEGELQWIRMALRFFYLLCCEDREHPDASCDHPVCQDWVRSQWRYYYRASRREAGIQRWLDRITWAAAAVGGACFVFAAIMLGKSFPCAFLSAYCRSAFAPNHFEVLQNLLTAPIALAVVLAAIFTHYEEKQNLLSNARRYERMFAVFDHARRDLLSIAKGNPGDSREIIYELGHAALIEHADWLIMRRDRPMKVVMV